MALCRHPVVFVDILNLPTIGGRRPPAQEVTKRSHPVMRSNSKSQKVAKCRALKRSPGYIRSVSVQLQGNLID
jgi:hypothetical protein